jgi:hypothetical protein
MLHSVPALCAAQRQLLCLLLPWEPRWFVPPLAAMCRLGSAGGPAWRSRWTSLGSPRCASPRWARTSRRRSRQRLPSTQQVGGGWDGGMDGLLACRSAGPYGAVGSPGWNGINWICCFACCSPAGVFPHISLPAAPGWWRRDMPGSIECCCCSSLDNTHCCCFWTA